MSGAGTSCDHAGIGPRQRIVEGKICQFVMNVAVHDDDVGTFAASAGDHAREIECVETVKSMTKEVDVPSANVFIAAVNWPFGCADS